MLERRFPWVVRLAWAALPFTAGPALAAALEHHAPVRTTASVALWAVWAAILVATLVAHPLSLTLTRTAAPGAAAAAVWAALAAAVVMFPAWSTHCVNGSAYPNERRYPLAVPGALLLGPLELSWALVLGFPTVAVLALADRRWVLGGITAAVGVPMVWLLGRALHSLSLRWAVFVPAGLVLCDPLSLLDPVLFQRGLVERLGPAAPDSDSLDLTRGAAGLALELVLVEKVPLVLVKPGHRTGETGLSARLLFTPSRPGAVLAEARSRRLPVAAPPDGPASPAEPPPAG